MNKKSLLGIILSMIDLFDLHNDFLTELKKTKKIHKYLSSGQVIKNSRIVSAVWTSRLTSEEAIQTIDKCADFITDYTLQYYDTQNMPKLSLAIEDLHFISKLNLAKLINLNPLYCSLTWNQDNILAGGAIEGGRLTPLGEYVIKELESNDIFIDTAHLSESSFMSFAKLTKFPILCSHTAFHSLTPHKRNLKDYQVRMIIESGGIIGLAFVGDFLTSKMQSTINDIARHIDYFVSSFGDENLCLGTDFFGTKNTPKKIKSYNNLYLLKERLRFLGYNEQMINNIFYLNAQRFFEFKYK